MITDEKETDEFSFVVFGKIGPDVYSLEIEAPFSTIQGIALAISTF